MQLINGKKQGGVWTISGVKFHIKEKRNQQ